MKVHEWYWLDEGKRTVCGQVVAPGKTLSVVRDLAKTPKASRCGNCESMRGSVGTSSKRAKEAERGRQS